MSKIVEFLRRFFGVEKLPHGKKTALCVGVGESRKYGLCPGASIDCYDFSTMLSGRGFSVKALRDGYATRFAVVNSLKKIVAGVPEDGVFVFYYSGHGGHQEFTNTHGEEDGMDEYMCMYDGMLLDDDFWKIVSKCKGRVFAVFDCCHSETMFRDAEPTRRDSEVPDAPVRMLVWSGCRDRGYSFGDGVHGFFTQAILRVSENRSLSYKEAWELVKADPDMKKASQNPQRSVLGGFDTDAAMFE